MSSPGMTRLELPDIQLFLEDRANTVEEIETLLQALENEQTRRAACAMLHQIARTLESKRPTGGLSFHKMQVPGSDEPIRIILHPAVFAPELWGRTFAEGLLKDPDVFLRKHIAELGTGSGWIGILLLLRTDALSVLGLDINPIAIVTARLNAWLNGSDEDGNLKNTQAGVPLVQAFRAELSDLLAQPLKRDDRFHHIIGCIPQVLHPDPSSLRVKKRLSHRDLYDLSNYCFEQGILEDRFGLPLIARALEQAQLCLRPGGMVTLILGGRPGQAAIEGVFKRRGYNPRLTWSRRINQADDTDLASLVELEKIHGINFHFFSSLSSKQSIPASTAVRLLESNRPLYHDLLVYQASTNFEKATLRFVRNLQNLGLSDMRRELDFSRTSEEQISFLGKLTQELSERRTIPYPHERGDVTFREKLARFLQIYCNYHISPDDLFVGAERSQLMLMILNMVLRSGEKILLSQSLQSAYGSVLQRRDCDVVVGNDDLSELLELDTLFEPRICLFAPHEMSDPSPIVLRTLIQQAQMHPNRWYLVDDSENFDIDSELRANVMMRILGEHSLPPNLIFIYGLIKNTVCPDLELTFMLNAPRTWLDGLEVGAELTYSRISYTTQLYYEWLFEELLAFPFAEPADATPQRKREPAAKLIPDFVAVADDPVFAPKPLDVEDPDVIRLDYGEFEHVVPDALVKGLIKGFLDDPSEDLASIMDDRVTAYLQSTRGVTVDPDRVILGQGVFPLLGALVETLQRRLGRKPLVAVPQGTYGPIFPLIQYHGGIVEEIPTDAGNGFLLSLQGIANAQKPDLLWLTQPGNPSGLFYSPDTVSGIIQLCFEKGIYIFADEIFFLLSDPACGTFTPSNYSFGPHLNQPEGGRIFLADGVSKAFAAGGLRCGFLVAPDAHWAAELQSIALMPPKSTLRAWDAVYSAFLPEAPHHLMDVHKELQSITAYLNQARLSLSEYRTRLLELLSKHNLADHGKGHLRGGLFLLAQMDRYISDLAREKKLLLNPGAWSRNPGWSRVCYSIKPDRFEEAFNRLSQFLQSRS